MGGAQRVEHGSGGTRRCGEKPGTSTVSALRQRLDAGVGDDAKPALVGTGPAAAAQTVSEYGASRIVPEDLRRDGEVERDDRVEGEDGDPMHWQDRNEQWHSCHSRGAAAARRCRP